MAISRLRLAGRSKMVKSKVKEGHTLNIELIKASFSHHIILTSASPYSPKEISVYVKKKAYEWYITFNKYIFEPALKQVTVPEMSNLVEERNGAYSISQQQI